MTKDKIMQMAREAGMQRQCHNLASNPVQYRYSYDGSEESLERFFHMAQVSEREAIAQMIEDAPQLVDFCKNEQNGCLVCGFTPKFAAKAIRSRGNHD